MQRQDTSGQSLLESEELFSFALEISHMGVWELSLDDHSARRTLGHDRIFGYDALLPVWNYETFLEHVIPDDRALVEMKFRAAVENATEWNFECRIRRTDGEIRWIWAVGRHRTGGNGARLIAGVVQDITAQKEGQFRLIESERRLKAIMDAAPIGIAVSDDASCELITGNPAFLAQFESDATDNVSASAADPSAAGRRLCVYREGRVLAARELPLQRAVAEGREIGPVDLEIALPSGRRWHAQAYAAPILDGAGKAIGGVAVTVDITERRAFEEAMRASERRERQHAEELKALLDTAPIGVAIALDPTGQHIRGNRANEEMFGLENGAQFSMKGPGAPSLEAYEGGRRLQSDDLPMQRALRGQTVTGQIIEFRRPDGGMITALAKATPLRNENGAISGAVGAFLDITALAQAQSALRRSESLLMQALDAANAGVWEGVPETAEFRASDRALALYGLPPGTQVTHARALEAVHPDDRGQVEAAITRSLLTKAPFRVEMRALQPDGSIRWLSSMAEARIEAGKTRFVGLVQDITERKLIEASLVQQEQRLSLALSAGRLATWDWAPSGDRAIWNDEAFDMLGYAPGEVEPGYDAWAARLHPEDRERVEATFAQAVEQGGEVSDQYRILLPNGEIKWIESRGRMARDGGRTVRSYGVLIDTTERKHAEEALREADRRKDEFLAMLAHELRNPLAPIRNAAFLLRRLDMRGAEAAAKTQSLLGMIERQVNHLVRLVDDLLEVSRITSGKIVLRKELVDLSTIVRQALQTSEPHIEANHHRVDVSCAETLIVDGDLVRLTQVFTNILNNAAKYTPPNGRISVDVTRAGEEAVVRIRDNGVGILPEMLPRIFNLFVQSERIAGREGGGIGVGLALARRLVEMHGGQIEAHSEGPDRGSEFIVRLPLASPDLFLRRARPGQLQGAGDPRPRVLVIDDDRDVADSFAQLLSCLGAQTRVACDGREALRSVEDFEPEFVFLDLGMPGMDGLATARSIRNLPRGADPTLVALSGWSQNEDRARTRDAGFDLHLTKPASPGEVLAILQGRIAAPQQ